MFQKLLKATTHPEDNGTQFKPVFWPADLLPNNCPDSRILTFGYDSKVTKYNAGEINQNSIFVHSKDLLGELHRGRERDPKRRLMFVAHSLGGIVVKEMLARSSSSVEGGLRNIVESTAMVVFLGTPHRGSQHVAALGEVVRSVVSSLGMKTTPVILDALGLKTTDLVVPDYSSSIGDAREYAETMQANHIGMCRYSGPNDPNYCKIAGALQSIYLSIPSLKAIEASLDRRIQLTKSVLSTTSTNEPPHVVNGSKVNEACLRSLWFPTIDRRLQSLGSPAEKTCAWLFDHKLYKDWFNGTGRHESYGLLWLKGKPGAGKSTLMKEAFHQAAREQAESNYSTAAFFFNAKGDELEHSSLGLFKSLLYQLLPGDKQGLEFFHKMWDEKNKFVKRDIGEEWAAWAESELESFLEWAVNPGAYLKGIDLNVCISSRHFPTITLSDCPEIFVEQHNSDDIETYVDCKFELAFATKRPQWELLKKNILQKSAGVFLWVVLVVEDVLRSWDDGNEMPYLNQRAMDLPEELETLFSNIFSKLEPNARELTVKFFQWAILATKPLRLYEWRHILAFIRQPTLKSLREWRQSNNFIESDEQLEKQIRTISRGLVEVKRVYVGDSQEEGIEAISNHAGAGSLDLEHGDSRIVQVIHESVREFFLRNNGFFVLDPGLRSNPIGNGHLSIMETCLDYLNIRELNALVQARLSAAKRIGSLKDRRTSSTVSSRVKSSSPEDGVLLMEHPKPRTPAVIKRRDTGSALFPLQAHSNLFDNSPFNFDSSSFVDHASSYDSISSKEHQLLHSKRSATKEERSSVSELLRSLKYNPSMKVIEWMTKDDAISVERASPDRSPCVSITYFHEISQELEDDPALLSYATFKLFTHAQLADKNGADLRPFIDRLKDEVTWARWVALREDIPHGTKASSYTLDMGLWSWIKSFYDGSISDASIIERIRNHEEDEKKERERGRKREEKERREKGEEFMWYTSGIKFRKEREEGKRVEEADARERERTQMPHIGENKVGEEVAGMSNVNNRHRSRSRHRSRTGSVASFSSAGSHG
ncbi:hypothetical protein TrVFT333_000194 [Trichoderma virens FT-333]|nr:hypothetical protein TrVFT333_000194 [Trichoderma virens FT-333]